MPPPAEGIASRLVLGPALRAQPDRRLVTLVREGYESAFEEIVRRYGRPLRRYAGAIVGGGRSEDVTQDAFSKALLALRRDDVEIELRPWLFRIVRNTALNDLRDSPPAPEVLAEGIAGGRSAAEEVELREELADLIKRLRALPEPQRAAIVMRELEGLSHEEIAAALGVSGGAARQAIHRARRALRNGAGMLIPLPLLKALLAGAGPGAAEAATGAAGIGSAAGAGVALKATAATVLVAGAVGTGVALNDNPRHGEARATPSRAVKDESREGAPATAVTTAGADKSADGTDGGEDRHGGQSDDGHPHGRHENEAGDDHGGRGSGDDHSGRGHGAGEGESGGAQPADNRGGGGSPGHGGPGHGGGDDSSGHSGHGGGDSSGHSGSRSGQDGSSSGKDGPGSGGSGSSGSSSGGGSGSGGSGSGGDPKVSEEPSGSVPEPGEEPATDGSGTDSGSSSAGNGSGGGGHGGHG